MKKLLPYTIIFIFAFLSLKVQAQKSDTIRVESEIDSTLVKFHSPKKAAIFSAILPGLGQYYNKKYWKIPIIWAAYAGSIYAISFNNEQYLYVKDIYKLYVQGDAATLELYGAGRKEYLKNVKDSYKRSRDLMFLVTMGLHALNIIDANVDAHFFTFDVSPNLSFKTQPILINNIDLLNSTAFGIKVSLNF